MEISVPPIGMAVFSAKATSGASLSTQRAPVPSSDPVVVESDIYSLSFSQDTGMLSSITHKPSKATTSLAIQWGWYNSSVGGCTAYPGVPADYQEPACTGQKSGAYIFRPNSSEVFGFGGAKPTIVVSEGELVTEVYQQFSEWATHVVRLYKGRNYVEVEWTAGPIPIDTPWLQQKNSDWGKEVIVKYASGLASQSTWYTDSNGKEMVKRVYNKRGPSYPSHYNISEPVAGNYYPVNAMMALDDGTNELAVLTDAAQGGASLANGELEFMVHRRIQQDDSRGVQEPLNETMCGCNDIGADPGNMGAHGHEGDGGCSCAGLTMRGRHWLIFGPIQEVHEARRVLSETINFPATLAFHKPSAQNALARTTFSAVTKALPANVKLVTLTSNYASHNDGALLLRLSHLYEAGEHDTLAQPVTVNLKEVFGQAGLSIASAMETTLTGNQPLEAVEARKHKWKTRTANQAVADQMAQCKSFEQRVPFTFPEVTIRPMEVRTFLATFE
jgi:hypothetical protein